MLPGLLIMAFIAAVSLFPGTVRAEGEDSLAYAERAIAPAVVRQGEFAVRLAEALAVEVAQDDEDDAMRALAALGVEPAGGWQPDQAVTPQIVTELRADLADALAAGRLAMETDAAWAAFDGLLAELGLPLPAEPAPDYAGASPPLNGYGPYCDVRTTHYFYGSYGLPLYSYCTPPAAFIHLYSWVPGGFHAHGHRFAGFFILRQVHVIPRTHDHRRFNHRFDGRKHAHDDKFKRRLIRVIEVPKAVRPAPRGDTRSEISRIQSNVMEHKSEIMRRLPPAVAPRAVPNRAIRFGVRIGAMPPRHAPPVHTHRDSRLHHKAAPRRMTRPAAAAAPMAPPAHKITAHPSRHHSHRTAASWNKRNTATPVADPRAQTRFRHR